MFVFMGCGQTSRNQEIQYQIQNFYQESNVAWEAYFYGDIEEAMEANEHVHDLLEELIGKTDLSPEFFSGAYLLINLRRYRIYKNLGDEENAEKAGWMAIEHARQGLKEVDDPILEEIDAGEIDEALRLMVEGYDFYRKPDWATVL